MTTHLGRMAIPAVALAIAVAGCGSSSERAATAGGGTPTVSVKNLAGFGAVLVDDQGHALYTPDQEASGKIRCTKGCTTFWDPLTASTSTPTAAPGVTAGSRPSGEPTAPSRSHSAASRSTASPRIPARDR